MVWSEVYFGSHKGKTLSQILFSDPDWFFWAIEKNVFQNKGALHSEAKDLYNKAKNIKIPNNEDEALVVEYVIDPSSAKFLQFDIVSANSHAHVGSSSTYRKKVIDMSLIKNMGGIDKRG